MHEDQNITTAENFYKFAQSGQWEEACSLVRESFTVLEAPDLPFGGTLSGKAAVRSIFELVGKHLNVRRAEIVQVVSGGDFVVTLLELITAADGREMRLSLAEALRFEDGQICELKAYYFDHNAVREAATARHSG